LERELNDYNCANFNLDVRMELYLELGVLLDGVIKSCDVHLANGRWKRCCVECQSLLDVVGFAIDFANNSDRGLKVASCH